MVESNTVVSAYTLYRHVQRYMLSPSICGRPLSNLIIESEENDYIHLKKKALPEQTAPWVKVCFSKRYLFFIENGIKLVLEVSRNPFSSFLTHTDCFL